MGADIPLLLLGILLLSRPSSSPAGGTASAFFAPPSSGPAFAAARHLLPRNNGNDALRRRHSPTRRRASTQEDNDRQQSGSVKSPSTSVAGINGGGASQIVDEVSVGSSLISMSDAKTQLFSAFEALDLNDQYDAVLTGLCAKVLDDPNIRDEQCASALKDPLQLLQEMNQKRISASPRSLMALVDVSAVYCVAANSQFLSGSIKTRFALRLTCAGIFTFHTHIYSTRSTNSPLLSRRTRRLCRGCFPWPRRTGG